MKEKILTAFLFAAILLGGCVQQQGAETVKIGAMGPLTGVRATAGEYLKNGLGLALEEINNDNTADGVKIDLVFEDTQYKPEVAVSGFRKLVDAEGIKFIVGFQNSSCLLAVAPIAEEKKVLVIGTGTQANKISEAGDYIFRTQIASRQEIPIIAKFVLDELNFSKIAILYILTDYGTEYNSILTREFEGFGGTVTASESFAAEANDFKTALAKVAESKPEAIFIAGTSKQVGLIKKQAHELGIKMVFIAGSATEEKDILSVAGQLADGIIYPYPYDTQSQDAAQKSFRDKYWEKYNEQPTMLSANAYDALKLLAEGLGKCGENTDCVKNFLYSVKDYNGASGIISFDRNGDVKKSIIIKTIKNGQFVLYEGG